MSQLDLARRLGISQQAVSKWEEGSATPRSARLRHLVDVMGKESRTAGIASGTLAPATNQQETTQVQHQEDALAALAQAAQQIAQAAQTLAESVERLTNTIPPPPPSKH